MTYPGTRHEAMLREAKKLVALLEDPQFGLFCWHDMVSRNMKELGEVYYERDYEGDLPKEKTG